MSDDKRLVAVVESHCTLCDQKATWTLHAHRGGQREWRRIDGEGTSFVCEHWSEHHEACRSAVERPTGPRRATEPPVDAHVLT